ncbi:MAG: hypothetical protein QW660_04530, partial [Candidatus Bathyarchaeia archaeon]
MEGLHRLRWILIFEALFAGVYVSLTRGLFVIYLASLRQSVEEISFVVLASSTASFVVGVLIYKKPSFITRDVKLKLVFFHALERVIWLLMPLTATGLLIFLLYATCLVSSSIISIFLAFAIYGSLDEDMIRDVTAKRSAANGISSILGFALGVFLLAFLTSEAKFSYIFPFGALLGLISTLLLGFLDLSHLEGKQFPKATEQPEKIFSTSTFFVILMASSNLMGLIWAPYVMNYLGGPDFLAASMNLAGTISSVAASLYWRKRTFKTLRISLALNTLGPAIILATPWPHIHPAINVYTSFTFTGANFLGTFLFARYNKWFGAVKSSVLLAVLGSLAQLTAASMGMFAKQNFMVGFSMALAVKAAATVIALIIIPEVAVVPEDVARTYSQVLYNTSLTGYRMSVEISKETILTTLRLLALSLVIVALYLIYRVLWILIG